MGEWEVQWIDQWVGKWVYQWMVQWVGKLGHQEVDLDPYTGFVPSWLRMQLRVQIVLDNSSVLQGVLH